MLLLLLSFLLTVTQASTPDFLECIDHCNLQHDIAIIKGCVKMCAFMHVAPEEIGMVHQRYVELERRRLLNKQL